MKLTVFKIYRSLDSVFVDGGWEIKRKIEVPSTSIFIPEKFNEDVVKGAVLATLKLPHGVDFWVDIMSDEAVVIRASDSNAPILELLANKN